MQDRFIELLEGYSDSNISESCYQNWGRLGTKMAEFKETILKSKGILNLEIKSSSKEGYAALHLAVLRNHYDLISNLVEAKADINVQDNLGRTPLHLAVLSKLDDDYEGQMTQNLLTHKANPNAVDHSGKTPLHVAIEQGCTSWRIFRLLESKAYVEIKDNRGKTSIDVAIDKGYNNKSLYGPLHGQNLIKTLEKHKTTPAQQLEALTHASHSRLGAASPANILFASPMGDRNVLSVIGLFLGEKEKRKRKFEAVSENEATSSPKKRNS